MLTNIISGTLGLSGTACGNYGNMTHYISHDALDTYFIASAAYISRIEEITNTAMARISAKRRDPDTVFGITRELRQRFQMRRQGAGDKEGTMEDLLLP